MKVEPWGSGLSARLPPAWSRQLPITSLRSNPCEGAKLVLVATEDRMIPTGQREMSERAGPTVVEVAGSHAIYVSQPAAVADLIKEARFFIAG